MKRVGNDEPVSAGDPLCHQHRFSDRGRAVVQRRVRHLHPCELADHRLKLERVLQSPLTQLGLIWRVSGEELGARDQWIDDYRYEMRVGARAKKRLIVDRVLRFELTKVIQQL